MNRQYYLHISIVESPDALFFKGKHVHIITAHICGNCGHLELTAQNPKALYQLYLQLKIKGYCT